MAAASPPQDQEQPAAEVGVAREDPAALTPRRARFPRVCHYRPNAAPPTPTPSPAPPPPRPRRNGNAGETPEYRVVTPLVEEPASPAELPRWRLRGMWELASVLNFLHVFRPLLNIAVEFTAEELEDAIITPNGTLYDVHMPLLKSIPPVTRMAMGRGTWIAVLCKKLKHWWHWVAEGDLPIVASHGAETELYKALEPGVRLVILKAICDIRGEQEDVRNFIDSSLKHGYHLSIFRKERIGGDSHGISYWYEDDPILGHRLYREIRRVEHVKESTNKYKGKGVSTIPVISYHWEAVASNFDEFKIAAEKLFASRNRTEVSLGKKLKFNYLPEIEKIHKKKEKLLKKQQREALLLDSCLTANGLTSGRSRRERKRVTYTFDDYDRSINEAIKTIRKNETAVEIGPSPLCKGFYGETPAKSYYKARTGEGKDETLHRSYRQRKRSQRYTKDYIEAVSDIDLDFDSDDDIMGEVVYDEEYLRRRKRYKASLSENDDEFQLEQVANDGDDEVDHSFGANEDTEELQWYKRSPLLTPQGTKLKSIDEIQIGIRRSKRSTRPRINYQQFDTFGANPEYGKSEKWNASDQYAGSDALNDMELSTSKDPEEEDLKKINKAQESPNGLSENDEFQLEQVANDGDDEVDHSLSANEDTEELQWYKRFPLLTPQGTKLKSIDEIQIGIRRSKRSTRPHINYQQLDTFGANPEYFKSEKCNASDPDAGSDALNDMELSTSQDPEEEHLKEVNEAQQQCIEKSIIPVKESRSIRRKFLDLNELAPIAGFDDASVLVKDKHMNNSREKCSAAH